MAVELEESKTVTATGKAKGTSTINTRERVGRKKSARRSGVERLRHEADQELRRVSKKLAAQLSEKALTPDLASIKMLVMLAESKRPRPKPVKRPRGLTLAQQLAADKPWKDPAEKEEARD